MLNFIGHLLTKKNKNIYDNVKKCRTSIDEKKQNFSPALFFHGNIFL